MKHEEKMQRSGIGTTGAAYVIALIAATACYQAEQSADLPSSLPVPSGMQRWSESGSGNTGAPMTGEQSLTLRFETAPLGGRFAPDHVMAVWVVDASGAFVDGLGTWGRSRAQYQRGYVAATRDGRPADVVTSATLTEHGMHELRWDFRDMRGQLVPDGSYRIRMELTDKNIGGPIVDVPFEKDGSASKVEIADTSTFLAVELTIE